MITDKEIEELANNYSLCTEDIYGLREEAKDGFIAGFKAAQSKLYTEEKVKALLSSAWKTATNFGNSVNYENWFEQHKK